MTDLGLSKDKTYYIVHEDINTLTLVGFSHLLDDGHLFYISKE